MHHICTFQNVGRKMFPRLLSCAVSKAIYKTPDKTRALLPSALVWSLVRSSITIHRHMWFHNVYTWKSYVLFKVDRVTDDGDRNGERKLLSKEKQSIDPLGEPKVNTVIVLYVKEIKLFLKDHLLWLHIFTILFRAGRNPHSERHPVWQRVCMPEASPWYPHCRLYDVPWCHALHQKRFVY